MTGGQDTGCGPIPQIHNHEYKEFVEKGCVDNKVYLICSCGKIKERSNPVLR